MQGAMRGAGCFAAAVSAGILVVGLSTAHASDVEQNKAMFKKFVDEVMNKGNVAMVDEMLAADFVDHEEMPLGIPEGREGCKSFFSMFHQAFPDVKVTVEDMIAEGDRVVARETWRATNTGEFMGMPATGKAVEFGVIDIIRFQDGKAVEHWGVSDRLAMMQQMHPETMAMPMAKEKMKSKE